MKFRRLLSLILASSAMLSFASCASDNGVTTDPAQQSDTASGSSADTTAAPVSDTVSETGAGTLTSAGTEPSSEPAAIPESIKILAIGNSFSTDAMQYLYPVLTAIGVKNIVLGNMYISGCSLETHLQCAKSGSASYTYYKNTSGNWVSTKSVAFEKGLTDESWDIITMQQTSKTCGLASSYGKVLTQLVDIVCEKKTNPDAKLLWHMTWAYQQNSTHSSFPNYGSSQSKMYSMIIDCTKSCILPETRFAGVIPTGTAIQNARTGFVGDTITRDGYHLNLTLGRYIAALSWAAYITGANLSDISYVPAADINEDCRKLAVESAMNAVKNPLEVTQSQITTGTWTASSSETQKTPVIYADCYEADRTLAAGININLDNYTLLEYEYIENAYYCCTKGTSLTTPGSSAGTYHQNICSKKIFSKDEIPENSVIICDGGWQYRPELWVSKSAAAASRPSLTSANITLLNASWWGQNNFFAFNIASSPKGDISGFYAAAATHVRIYVPKNR